MKYMNDDESRFTLSMEQIADFDLSEQEKYERDERDDAIREAKLDADCGE